MSEHDPRPGEPGMDRRYSDQPPYAPPATWSSAPQAQTGPRFDPTRPLTGPGSVRAGTDSPTATPRPGTPPAPFRPRRRMVPTLITFGVLLVAVLVIGGATLIARQHDLHATAAPAGSPSSTQVASVGPSPAGNSIAFQSSDGSGTLTIASYDWTTHRSPPPSKGDYLEVRVRLQVDHGSVHYAPYLFQAFDATGDLFDPTETATREPALGTGDLAPGQSTTGWVSFDIRRGDTTVLLGDADSDPIAALKVKG